MHTKNAKQNRKQLCAIQKPHVIVKHLFSPKLSVSHFGFIKNYYKKYGLCHLATSKWKTRWDCRSYRIYGVRYLPA